MVILRKFPKPNSAAHTTQNRTAGFNLTQQWVLATSLALIFTELMRVRILKTCVSDRTKLARSKQLCFNCLQTGHNVSPCSSNYTWRECHRPHYTLSNCYKNWQAYPLNKKMIQTYASSVESEEKPLTADVNSHCKVSHEGQEYYSSSTFERLGMFFCHQLTFHFVTRLAKKYRCVHSLPFALTATLWKVLKPRPLIFPL